MCAWRLAPSKHRQTTLTSFCKGWYVSGPSIRRWLVGIPRDMTKSTNLLHAVYLLVSMVKFLWPRRNLRSIIYCSWCGPMYLYFIASRWSFVYGFQSFGSYSLAFTLWHILNGFVRFVVKYKINVIQKRKTPVIDINRMYRIAIWFFN